MNSRPRSHSFPIGQPLASIHLGADTRRRRLTSPPFPRDEGPAFVVDKDDDYPVAGGAYSDVWKATMTRPDGVTSVALKVMRPMGLDPDRFRRRLERELCIWKMLQHESIALFYGVAHQTNGIPAIVLPWYENGTANAYLREHPDVDPTQPIREIAMGIEYLHERGIVHADLKGTNVMIDDQGHAKLIDFGLARVIDAKPGLTTSTTTTIRWCALELVRSDDARMTKSSDVYAFASTALELLTGELPYPTLGHWAVASAVYNGVSPRSLSTPLRYDISHSEALWGLLDKCWDGAALRPSIRDVQVCLQQLFP